MANELKVRDLPTNDLIDRQVLKIFRACLGLVIQSSSKRLKRKLIFASSALLARRKELSCEP